MEFLTEQLLAFAQIVGSAGFIAVSVVLAGLLCFVAIPYTTDLMVNNAAGLSGRVFGPSSRTLVINASTNNPEAFSMAIAFVMGRMGGWANPLGSLLANVYLMYGIAFLMVGLRYAVTGQWKRLREFVSLLWRERTLVAWHVIFSLATFGAGTLALWLMGTMNSDSTTPETGLRMWLALGVLVVSVIVLLMFDRRLKRKRPNLYDEIDASQHGHSVLGLIFGTLGLILACGLMNILFLAWTRLYGDTLSTLFGAAVFAALHYFVGALITSLPELRVATANYRRLTVPDLNTGLASASYSNLVNLVLGLIGIVVFIILVKGFGVVLPW